MKKLFLSLFATMMFTGTAFAECSVTMPYEKLVDCIVIEGAGDVYVDGEGKSDSKLKETH